MSDQPVARPLLIQDNTTQKDADKHSCLKRDSNLRSHQPTGQYPCLRPHVHCDRPNITYTINKTLLNGLRTYQTVQDEMYVYELGVLISETYKETVSDTREMRLGSHGEEYEYNCVM
jgi:hypothetical protein